MRFKSAKNNPDPTGDQAEDINDVPLNPLKNFALKPSTYNNNTPNNLNFQRVKVQDNHLKKGAETENIDQENKEIKRGEHTNED